MDGGVYNDFARVEWYDGVSLGGPMLNMCKWHKNVITYQWEIRLMHIWSIERTKHIFLSVPHYNIQSACV